MARCLGWDSILELTASSEQSALHRCRMPDHAQTAALQLEAKRLKLIALTSKIKAGLTAFSWALNAHTITTAAACNANVNATATQHQLYSK